jgi:TPR repeat protein
MSEEEPIRFAQVFRGKPATFVERGPGGELASVPHVSPERLASVMEHAAQGDAEAQYRLSFYYRKGMGVKQSLERSHHWLQRAADGGFSAAQTVLGMAYKDGDYLEQNRDAASKWLNLAAANGCPVAAQILRNTPDLR